LGGDLVFGEGEDDGNDPFPYNVDGGSRAYTHLIFECGKLKRDGGKVAFFLSERN